MSGSCQQLERLFAALDREAGALSLEVLETGLRGLTIDSEQVRSLSCFDASCYCRNRLRLTPAYEALLMCWAPGQASQIHDHAGSACAFRVLHGAATEIRYARCSERDGGAQHRDAERAPAGIALAEPVVAWESVRYGTDSICSAMDDEVHCVENREETALVTLHIYSPPLKKMGGYRDVRALSNSSTSEAVAAPAQAALPPQTA